MMRIYHCSSNVTCLRGIQCSTKADDDIIRLRKETICDAKYSLSGENCGQKLHFTSKCLPDVSLQIKLPQSTPSPPLELKHLMENLEKYFDPLKVPPPPL